MTVFLVALLVVLYSFQSLFLKLFSAKYPAEKSALASTVFNISYGAFAGVTTLCVMGFRFSASRVTLICGLVNAVTLLVYNVSMIQASRKGSYAFQMIAMLFGGIVVPMLHSVIFLGDRLSLLQVLAVALMLVSFVLSWIVFLQYDGNVRVTELFTWFASGTFEANTTVGLVTIRSGSGCSHRSARSPSTSPVAGLSAVPVLKRSRRL